MSDSDTLIREGAAPFHVDSLNEPCSTYYKIVGDLTAHHALPLVIVHGGPGAGHEYLLPFSRLWELYKIPVVFYDQVGCASSTHLRHLAGDRKFWHIETFLSELDSLLEHLKLASSESGYFLFGQSWGGKVAAEFATRRPKGLRRLILANALASEETASKGYRILRDQLPADILKAFNKAEQREDYDSEDYKRGTAAFGEKYLCRTRPLPPELLSAMKNLREDNTASTTLLGPSALTITGTQKGWTCVPSLPQISVPTLVYNGEFDTAHDVAQIPFFELIPRVRWITFPGAGHMCHLEDGLRERVLGVVGDFLAQEDKGVSYVVS